MYLEPLNLSLTQISILVNNLNKKNFVQNCESISQLVEQFGLEADRHYLRCLFSTINFSDPSSTAFQCKLLNIELIRQLNKPAVTSNICFAIDNCFHCQKTLKPTNNIIIQICKATTSSKLVEVILALSLTHSQQPDFQKLAVEHLKRTFPTLIESYTQPAATIPSERDLNDISPDLLQLILSVLNDVKQSKQYGISEDIKNKFLNKLREDFPEDRVPLILAPFLYQNWKSQEIDIKNFYGNLNEIFTNESRIMDTSWINLILEIGYDFTSTVEDCKNHLRCGRELQAQDVAKIIALMCRTHTSLLDCNVNLPTPASFWPDQNNKLNNNESISEKKDLTGKSTSETTQTWKPDIFVQALKEIVPNLNWKDVCVGFDHPEFVIKDRLGLNLLLTIHRLGSQANPFPAECLYRHWNNVEGQFSLVSIMLKNSDLFSFADYIYTSVPVELLKTLPETENKDITAWKSLHLVEVLLYIAEHGYYGQVYEIFKFPAQNCPDVLFLALLQINPPPTSLRQDLFKELIPTFLANHPNSGVILHHAWNTSTFAHSLRPTIMNAMTWWYLRGEKDQSRLTRILDVAQDLKALSNLLNSGSFIFVIDLACLASRREYLKLDKWLNDKIREHGEGFIQEMVKFLQRRCPQITGTKITEEPLPKAVQLPHDTLLTMIACLQACVANVQPELCNIIMEMSTNCNLIVNKQRQQNTQPTPNVLRATHNHRGIEQTGFGSNVSVGAPTQVFGPGAVDTLANLNTNIAGLNINGPNGALNFGNVLGSLVSTPASPSRLMNNQSNSPFPLMISNAPPNINNNVSRLPNSQSTGTNADVTLPLSKEVEDEANSYFQRIYNHPPHATLSIDEVLDMLQRFKESTIIREQQVYQCMLRNLFEEYRFFPQYPDKELQITAQLFGGIIERNLVPTFVALGLALRCVLDALRKQDGSKMYYFGITALDRFKTRLHQYNKYCEYVRSIPHFHEFPPHLVQYVEFGYMSQEPPSKPQGQVLPPSSINHVAPNQQPVTTAQDAAYRSNSATGNVVTSSQKVAPTNQPIHQNRVKSIATATNIDTLLANQDREEKITIPPDAIQDKTAFIFNNLSQLNLQTKCEEIKEIITKEYFAWLAQYLVLKRASIELNFHTLYSNFLDALKNNEVLRLVTRDTFKNIRILLSSDKGVANFSDRSLLKNLGHWLGMMTLGRSKPILQIDLDLKSLLVEAYNKGQQELLYIVPFVAKVLESCAKSKVFKPPNPWTMGLMNVLGELHTEPELKLNLKFEIEVLCKTLSIDIKKLKPIIYLKDPERILTIELQLSQQKKPVESTSMGDDHSIVLHNSTTNPSPSISNESAGQVVLNAPEPRYRYMDINPINYAALNQHVVIAPTVMIFHTSPALKAIAETAVCRTVNEWLQPVVDRSVRIAVSTTYEIIRKDFSLDADEQRLQTAAHHMVRNLAAGLAMITCKDQLCTALTTNIRKALATAAPMLPVQELETASQQVASDNVELSCCFIQKTAAEKAIPDVDNKLSREYSLRKLARDDGGRHYCDAASLKYQSECMPDQIRLKVGGVSNTHLAVYNEFGRSIPGFLPMTERDAAMFLPKVAAVPPVVQEPSNPVPLASSDELGVQYSDISGKMEALLNNIISIGSLNIQATKMHSLLNALVNANRNRNNESALNLLQRAVEGLIEGLINTSAEHAAYLRSYKELHIHVLNFLRNTFGSTATERVITKCIFEVREEVRYNFEAIKLLIISKFINIQQFDLLLIQYMDNGASFPAVQLGMQLIQHFLIDERSNGQVSEQDLVNTVDMLTRLAQHHRGPEGLTHLIETLRHEPLTFLTERSSGPSQYIHSGLMHVKANDCEDPPGLQEKTEFLLKDWVQIYYTQMNGGRDSVKTFGMFVNKMNLYGILKTDDLITRFFRQATQFCTDLVYRILNDPTNTQQLAKSKIFHWIDAFVRLIALLVRHSGDAGNPATKINLLNKVLGIVLGVLLQDQEIHSTNFQQLGYQRFFTMLFTELSSSDPVLENLMLSIVTAFSHTYHMLNPSVAPAFCYSWLELISHRVFIGRILAQIPQQKGWPLYAQLLLDLFKYLAPFLRNAELAKPVQLLYKGSLRVLLVLLHDFPEFLCDYHFGFCDAIPPNCIQMRNIILAAFPRNMRLPDPFTPNLKVDMLPETATAPKIFTNYEANIKPDNFKKDLDSYLKARAPVTFLSELRTYLQISNEPGSRYNIPLMNALVLYVGTQAIAHIRSKNLVPNTSNIVHSAHMDIFQNLAVDLDTEGRYLFLNAIANQLRYPNSHTHYFSCAVLYLFAEANSVAIQEQITRVLLERLIVNRPHPWGLLITFIELIKNPIYKFWDHDFVHCAPEIEKLFESVARSCLVKANNHHQQMANIEGELQEVN